MATTEANLFNVGYPFTMPNGTVVLIKQLTLAERGAMRRHISEYYCHYMMEQLSFAEKTGLSQTVLDRMVDKILENTANIAQSSNTQGVMMFDEGEAYHSYYFSRYVQDTKKMLTFDEWKKCMIDKDGVDRSEEIITEIREVVERQYHDLVDENPTTDEQSKAYQTTQTTPLSKKSETTERKLIG